MTGTEKVFSIQKIDSSQKLGRVAYWVKAYELESDGSRFKPYRVLIRD